MLTAKEKSLLDALEPQAAQHGIEIVMVEVIGAKKAPTIRVYIDCPQGVGFDELASSQAWINDIIDQIDPFPGAYTLEVSSPGIDRPLRSPEHFRRFLGETVVVSSLAPVDGRSRWTGLLLEASEEAVQIDVDGTFYELRLDNIKRAQLKGKIDFKSENARDL